MDALEGLELLVDLLTLEVKDVCERYEVENIKVQ
jgi:hypothetical protein